MRRTLPFPQGVHSAIIALRRGKAMAAQASLPSTPRSPGSRMSTAAGGGRRSLATPSGTGLSSTAGVVLFASAAAVGTSEAGAVGMYTGQPRGSAAFSAAGHTAAALTPRSSLAPPGGAAAAALQTSKALKSMLAEVQSGDDQISRMLRDLATLPAATPPASELPAAGQAAAAATAAAALPPPRSPALSLIQTALDKADSLEEIQRIIDRALAPEAGGSTPASGARQQCGAAATVEEPVAASQQQQGISRSGSRARRSLPPVLELAPFEVAPGSQLATGSCQDRSPGHMLSSNPSDALISLPHKPAVEEVGVCHT